MRAIVTRPAHDAVQWVADLQAHGIAAVALPLIEITPCPGPQVQAARERLAGYRAVMFVSGNAVQHFYEPNWPLARSGSAQTAIETRAWSPGPGTARALRALGVPAARIDSPAPDAPQFDSEALWARVAPQIHPGDKVLIVRGTVAGAPEGAGRDWLAAQIRQAGGSVDFVAVYARGAPRLTPAQQALAREAAGDGSLWLLSSSEAVAHLCAALPGQSWARARALATHPRIAQAAQAAGFGCVKQCKPALADVVASIESTP